MKNDNETPNIEGVFVTRQTLLNVNSDLIFRIQKRLQARRFKPMEGDTIKLGYIRALIQALEVHSRIIKDVELDEIEKRLQALESSQVKPEQERFG